MSRPTDDTGNREYRRKQFLRKTEHRINKPRIEVDIRRDALLDVSTVCDNLRRDSFNRLVNLKFLFKALFVRKFFNERSQNVDTGIGQGIHGVSHAVNEPCVVKRFLFKDFIEIRFDMLVVEF